jgi:hypothetical protein
LLAGALAIALGAGRTIEAVIIGVCLGFEVALVAVSLFAARRLRERRSA